MLPSVKKWIRKLRLERPEYFFFRSVLEMVHPKGASLKERFWFCRYKRAATDSLADGSVQFDTIISNEVLQYDRYWHDSLLHAYINLKPEGMLIVIAAGKERQRSPAEDYQPVTAASIISAFGITPCERYPDMGLAESSLFSIGELQHLDRGETIVFWGIKR